MKVIDLDRFMMEGKGENFVVIRDNVWSCVVNGQIFGFNFCFQPLSRNEQNWTRKRNGVTTQEEL